MTPVHHSAKDYLMRYTPAALALALLAGVTSSIAYSEPGEKLEPLAAALVAQGDAALAKGNADGAIDAYEAALVIQPGNAHILIELAEATRFQGMHGKALHYYREALTNDPRNVTAIAGEGAALAQKGAVHKAERNLARLKGLCGSECDATKRLSAVLAAEPATRMVRAEAVKSEPVVTEN
jgi:tetratricopeptide (TPR) repeat protein